MTQVAKAAGVSTQTVSRVLNNHPDVAVKTLERVRQVIKEMGYAPNILARSLIQGRSYTLGVVAYGLDYYGPTRVLTGIEQKANELGYSILLNLLHQPETRDVDHLLDGLLARQVDGLIWAIPEIGSNRHWAQAKSVDFPVPIIFVGGMTKPSALPLVGIDNRAIGRLATQHLLQGGARRVGIITGPMNWWEAQQRKLGWQETLEAQGLAAEDRLQVVGDWTANSGRQGLYEMLAHAADIDAVFASNDQMALGVLHAAHRLGRRVPENLLVVGVDNIPEAAHFWPPLTTIRQQLQVAGTQAVSELNRMIQRSKQSKPGPETVSPNTTLLEPELIVRESSHAVDQAQ